MTALEKPSRSVGSSDRSFCPVAATGIIISVVAAERPVRDSLGEAAGPVPCPCQLQQEWYDDCHVLRAVAALAAAVALAGSSLQDRGSLQCCSVLCL